MSHFRLKQYLPCRRPEPPSPGGCGGSVGPEARTDKWRTTHKGKSGSGKKRVGLQALRKMTGVATFSAAHFPAGPRPVTDPAESRLRLA
jgi:hypothetical protein